MTKKKTITSGQIFGIVLLVLGLGLDFCFIPMAYLAGFDNYYASTVGVLTLIIPSFMIFLGVMFLVFVPSNEKFSDDLD